MSDCEAELCGNWTGEGCACAVFGVEPDVSLSCDMAGHPDAGDGVCRCGAVVYYEAAVGDSE